ncbi:hypothetical protein [Lentzea nigeriaca]|uniref:hypothetical protein n=1 Tax=Lentzea nigeriaca TaxID=1128665 RepID=UPI0019591630|nr:hypothetical protein [Lentzea nigeriaca]MBM7862456.1 hypothetical protein [Lentzea nigeriaca]
MGEKLHESDRLVLAGQPVPADLMPHDRLAGGETPKIVRAVLPLSDEQRAEVRAFADSLPRQQRMKPAEMPLSFDHFVRSEGPGALVMRLLSNRNMDQSAVARAVAEITRGGRYWAASTYAIVGTGRKELTPDLLGDLAPLLDIPADVLGTLTGVTPEGIAVPGLGEIIWAVRRLTRAQAEEVRGTAEAMSGSR